MPLGDATSPPHPCHSDEALSVIDGAVQLRKPEL